jgi:hypothetical protein
MGLETIEEPTRNPPLVARATGAPSRNRPRALSVGYGYRWRDLNGIMVLRFVMGMRELLVSDYRTVRSRSRNPPQGPAPQGAQPGAEPTISSGGFFAGLLCFEGWFTLRVSFHCCSTRGLVDNLDNVVISVYNKMGDGWHLKNRPSGCDISYP